MKNAHPVFGSLGSNYTFVSACQMLWQQCFPDSASKVQSELAQKLQDLFVEFREPYFFATGRDAIQFALQTLPLAKKSKVLTQAFACAAIEEAILGAGMQPIFVDIAAHSVNISLAALELARVQHPEAKVVLVQHLFGAPADIANIRAWCDEQGLLLIEDLAQSFGGKTAPGARLGSFGHVLVTSFGRDKILDSVAGGACLFRQGVLEKEPGRQQLRSRSTWRQAVYPLLTVCIRASFSAGIGKGLRYLSQKFGVITSPVLRTTPVLERLSVGQAKAVGQQLATLPEELTHRLEISAVYSRLLKPHEGSFLRVPLVVPNPDELALELKKSNFFLTDRWYRKAVDSGSVIWHSTYEAGSCPEAEKLAQHIFTLPTHKHISVSSAFRLATTIRALLDKKVSYSTKIIEDKEIWEASIASCPEANFLQSWYWGEFQEKLGREIVRLGVFKEDKLVGVALGIFERARRGTFCSVPAGPLLDWSDAAAVATLFSALKEFARQKNCVFIRFRPQLIDDAVSRATIEELRAVRAPMHVTADRTIELDLTKSEVELLAQMRKNTRSSIRKADELQIQTKVSFDPADIRDFYEEQRLVAERHAFVPFSYEFLLKQFQTFVAEGKAMLVSAYSGTTLLATAFVLLYHDQAIYHYGISTEENAKLPGSYAVQWRVIKEAQAAGCTSYNLWGVAPPGADSHRFAGVSLFKRGFGGKEIQYLEAHDIPLKSVYWVTHVFEQVRKWRRRL